MRELSMSRFYYAKVTLAALVVTMSSGVAHADFERGLGLYERGDVAGAVDEWKQGAEEGNVVAAFLLGHMYKSGNGVVKSDRLALPYFLQASEAGHPAAQVQAALYFYAGNEEADIDQDYTLAGFWFDKAALQYSGEAQYYLGVIHRLGQGVPRDRVEGLRWLLLASKKAHVPAFLDLAEIFARGEGVVEDPIKAAMYLDLARRYVDPAKAADVSIAQDDLQRFIPSDSQLEGHRQAEIWVQASNAR